MRASGSALHLRLVALGGPQTTEVDAGQYDTIGGNACLYLTVRELQDRRRCIQQDHLAQAARALRNLCGKQLLSAEGRAHHAATVAVVPDWERLVQRARHDDMAEFWHVCHVAFMLNVRMVVVRPPA
eukprot:gene28716-25038_t